MENHLSDWENKFVKISSGDIHRMETDHKPIFIQVEGTDISEAERVIKLFTIRGRIPEPLRISHIVASGIVMGESKGKP